MVLEELNKDERYRIEGRVGSGAMATVYKAYDLRLQRIVALKILHEHLSSQTELRLRFEQEAKLAARIDHPNVVRIYDFGVNNQGQLFIVSEFIDGRSLTLAQRKYSSQPSPALHAVLAALVALEIAKGIEAAHRHSVVHRDLKPDNVLVHSNGEVKLTDFGVARPFDSSMTQAGQFIGSLTYASPEQIQGGKVDARSDIFSFGVILFELLTGLLPFRSSNPTDLAIKITQANVPPLNQLRPSIPIDLDTIVRRCLRVDPAQRPQTAEQLVTDLTRYLISQEVVPSSRVVADGFESPMLFASTIRRSPLLQDETKIVAEAEQDETADKHKKLEAESKSTSRDTAKELTVAEPEIKVDTSALKQKEQKTLPRKARVNSPARNPAPQPSPTPNQLRSRNSNKGLLSFFLLTLTMTALLMSFVFRGRQHIQDYFIVRDSQPTALPSEGVASNALHSTPSPQSTATATVSPTVSATVTATATRPAAVETPTPTQKPQNKLNAPSKAKQQKPAAPNKTRQARPSRPTKAAPQSQASGNMKSNRPPVTKPSPAQSASPASPTQLVVRTEPGEMTIYINGVFEGLSSRSGLTRTFTVPAGNVLLQIPQQEHNGKKYQEYTRRIRIESGKTLELPVINLNALDPELKKEQ